MSRADLPDPNEPRKRRLALLARADRAALERVFAGAGLPDHSVLKAEETGTVMVEGRAGGAGRRFNLGEATVTRRVVRVGEHMGVSYALGRDKRKARLAAVIDALMQDDAHRDALEISLLAPLESALRAGWDRASRKAAATKVEFFTLVRGEG